jgi:hypothetical protein
MVFPFTCMSGTAGLEYIYILDILCNSVEIGLFSQGIYPMGINGDTDSAFYLKVKNCHYQYSD